MSERSFPGGKENPASGAGSEGNQIGAQSIRDQDRQHAQSSQAAKSVDFANIPVELRRLPQWAVATGRVKEDGTIDKRPIDPRSGRWASPTDSSTWATFDECMTSLHPLVGFMLSANDPYTVIDLDDKAENPASDADKEVFRRIVAAFDSYAEVSASGRGVHIVMRGHVPRGIKRDRVEVYSSERFMLFSGSRINDRGITNQQPSLDALFAEMDTVKEVELIDVPEVESDEVILDRARRAADGEKFERLWSGQIEEWGGDRSKADMALLGILAFYTKSNEQVCRLFWASVLGQRAKAQRKDYLPRTLRKVRGSQTPVDMDAVAANVKRLIAQHTAEQEQAQAEVEFPPGPLGDLARFNLDASVIPGRAASLAGALAAGAGLAGRSYNVFGTGLNLYIALVIRSGGGKEDAKSAVDRVEDIAQGEGVPAAGQLLGPDDFASGAALVKLLSKQHCFVSVLDEFGRKLQQMSGNKPGDHQAALRTALMSIFTKSGAGQKYRGKAHANDENSILVIPSPAVTLLGLTTPETFLAALDDGAVADGFVSRLLIVESDTERPQRNRNPNRRPDDALAKRVAEVACAALNNLNTHHAINVDLNDAAATLLDAFEEEARKTINRAEKDRDRELWARGHLKAVKLAALVAVFENPNQPVIGVEGARWAIKLVRKDLAYITTRIERGELGGGESLHEVAIRKAVETFLTHDAAWRKQYRVPKFLSAHAVPIQFLKSWLIRRKPFSELKVGADCAIDAALASLVRREVLTLLDERTCKEQFDASTTAYVPGSSW